ncbi:MAG: UTRA domain-containing protein [Anaerolineales bacterium]|nr:UTRA domain-containing protein [Anaerolineales bacterium]
MKDQIDRESKLPLYQQLYELLRTKIQNKEWGPGDMLPTETELLEQYQVSRATVRQALDELVNESLIYRERGRGTFVSHPTVDQTLVRIVSFTEDMRQRGFKPGTRVLFFGLVPATQELAEKLEVPLGEELVRLERLRLADGEPMSIEESHLIHSACPGVCDFDYAHNSLRETLEKACDIRLTRANQVIRAIPAPDHLVDTLSIQPDTALLFIERISYSQHNLPIEFLRLYHRGDRYVLYNGLRG